MIHIYDLPTELLVYIFNNLQFKDIIVLSHVSKLFYQIMTNNVWNTVCPIYHERFLPKTISFKKIHIDYTLDWNNFMWLNTLTSIDTISFRCLNGINYILNSVSDHLLKIGCKNIIIGAVLGPLDNGLFCSGFNYYLSNRNNWVSLKISSCQQNIILKKYTMGKHLEIFGNMYLYDRLKYGCVDELFSISDSYVLLDLPKHEIGSYDDFVDDFVRYKKACEKIEVSNMKKLSRRTNRKINRKNKRINKYGKYSRRNAAHKATYVPKYFYSR